MTRTLKRRRYHANDLTLHHDEAPFTHQPVQRLVDHRVGLLPEHIHRPIEHIVIRPAAVQLHIRRHRPALHVLEISFEDFQAVRRALDFIVVGIPEPVIGSRLFDNQPPDLLFQRGDISRQLAIFDNVSADGSTPLLSYRGIMRKPTLIILASSS